MPLVRRLCVPVGLITLTPALSRANVILEFSDHTATPTTEMVAPNTSFTVSLLLVSSDNATADQVTGLDYNLVGPSSGIFTIVSRNSQSVNSSFTDTYVTPDSSLNNTPLDPSETDDLGASEANTSAPVSDGMFEVADYTISVENGTAPGSYTLTASAPASKGYGYVGPNTTMPPNIEMQFASIGSFVVVVPEPSAVSLGMVAAIGLLCRRRRPSADTCADKG